MNNCKVRTPENQARCRICAQPATGVVWDAGRRKLRTPHRRTCVCLDCVGLLAGLLNIDAEALERRTAELEAVLASLPEGAPVETELVRKAALAQIARTAEVRRDPDPRTVQELARRFRRTIRGFNGTLVTVAAVREALEHAVYLVALPRSVNGTPLLGRYVLDLRRAVIRMVQPQKRHKGPRFVPLPGADDWHSDALRADYRNALELRLALEDAHRLLSPREADVFDFYLENPEAGIAEAAVALGIAPGTVKVLRSHIRRKLIGNI